MNAFGEESLSPDSSGPVPWGQLDAVRRLHGDVDAQGMPFDFAVNVAGRPPSWLRAALEEALGRIAAYPSADALQEAEAALAALHGVQAENVMLLAGASEGFARLGGLARQRGITRGVVVHPGFSEPEIALIEAGFQVEHAVLKPPFDALPTIPAQRPSAGGTVVVIGNPANPTGVVHTPEALQQLPCELLVVDEAFLDMVGEQYSLAAAAAHSDRILVLRSLTKTWGIAGLRVGYAIGTAATLAELGRNRAQWPMGTLQIQAAKSVAAHADQALPGIRQRIAAEKQYLLSRLAALGFEQASATYPSVPYLLVCTPWGPKQAEKIRLRLREHGVSIRRCDTFPGLDSSYWRVAVRGRPQVEALCTALQQVLEVEAEAESIGSTDTSCSPASIADDGQ